MTVKGQLSACRDFLMAAIRASIRNALQNENAGKILQACLDLVEELVRKADRVTADEVMTVLDVLTRAAQELDDDTPASTAVVAAVRNAIGRMQTLRTEMAAK
jgi:hypothetical protein